MKIKRAFYRAVRTGAQTAAGVLIGVPIIEGATNIEVLGSAWLFAGLISLHTAGVSFLQNIGEDVTDTALVAPKS